jgi:hypothetical protein
MNTASRSSHRRAPRVSYLDTIKVTIKPSRSKSHLKKIDTERSTRSSQIGGLINHQNALRQWLAPIGTVRRANLHVFRHRQRVETHGGSRGRYSDVEKEYDRLLPDW